MSKKSYAVFGLGRFGAALARELANSGAEVMAIDKNPEHIKHISEEVTCAIQMDVCDVAALESLGISNMDAVIVAIGHNVNASAMVTIFAKESGVKFVLAKAEDAIHTRILMKVGADKVFIPEKESSLRIARGLLEGNFIDFVELSADYRLIEIAVPKEWYGKCLANLDLRKRLNINVIGVREDGELKINIDIQKEFTKDMTVVMIANRKDLDRLLP